MIALNDAQIRSSLIEKIKNQAIKPKAVIEELRIHNGNAIADVVALYKDAHCYEIKGDNDKIVRILEQGYYYNLAFRKITLVTTNRHLKKAIEISPEFWGIITVEKKDEQILMKHIRKAKNNSIFNKSLALLTLWKSEMLNLIQPNNIKAQNKSRKLLAQHIARKKGKEELSKEICSLLINRFNQLNTY